MIAVTGANGQLGQLVIEGLVERVPANQLIAAVRSPEKTSSSRMLGVRVREADYRRPETLGTAFQGVQKVLLISVDEVNQRFKLHKAVVDAAKEAGVELLVYTSLLHADSSKLCLAREHKQTEEYIRASGLPFVILRNGWYLENHTSALRDAVKSGELIGSSGDGRFASASRGDYAAAAVAVLTQPVPQSETYELAGDRSFSMAELASEVARQIGRDIPYRNLSGEDYAATLLGFGLSQAIVDVVIDADTKSMRGDLNSTSRDLSRLIGRPTTTLSDAVRSALRTL